MSVLGRYEQELLTYFRANRADVLSQLKNNAKLQGELEDSLKAGLKEFAKQFQVEAKA